eukprot:TRINITY_DN44522_c0_g1_i1.p1 TRINITY_DN44522_c0_g1~~TRINITY_DN44522_c0_g1_i1.p1  ORF type:complete len:1645 (-),score=457.04 TRINITY_DN44522_c0_g1_i1:566-5500(-)
MTPAPRVNVRSRGRLRTNVVAAHIVATPQDRRLKIAGVELAVPTSKFPDHVPALYGPTDFVPAELAEHFRWMLKKMRLGQDVFLIGPPGPFRRRFALWCCEVLGLEVEYVALSRDTTENDLKQRREIVGGSLEWADQGPVRAAIEGRVLILDGIDKAERNVLPTLNNLLENREMQLQDGRFLASPLRYEDGDAAKDDSGQLVPVSPHFRVVALGVPVPAFPGFLLDPPLRSRFQARYLGAFSVEEHLGMLERDFPSVPEDAQRTLVAAVMALQELWLGSQRGETALRVVPCPEDLPRHVATLLAAFPELVDELFSLVHRSYPSALLGYEPNVLKAVEHALQAQGQKQSIPDLARQVSRLQLQTVFDAECEDGTTLRVPRGAARASRLEDVVVTEAAEGLLSGVVQDFALGRDVAVIGHAGEGKTAFARVVAASLGFGADEVYTMQCFKDMTSRDLIQRRVTDGEGNTYWKDTPLVVAAERGGLLILDGLHRLTPDSLASIRSLLFDRDLWLPDGTHLVSSERFEYMKAKGVSSRRLRQVAASFRVLALGAPAVSRKPSDQWLTAEVLPLFSWHCLPELQHDDELRILELRRPSSAGSAAGLEHSEALERLLALQRELSSTAKGNADWRLSLRQLLRLGRRAATHPDSVQADIHRTVMSAFWPVAERKRFEELVAEFFQGKTAEEEQAKILDVTVSQGTLDIGGAQLPIAQPAQPELVPKTLFFYTPRHLLRLREIMRDLELGERHILLIGNQGTGKNKLVDNLLQLLRWEREYIQLHRDTTVQSLTVQPTLEAGVVRWEDSPLVRAVRHGRALVCDEADKAATEVVCVLKGLVEDGEMQLSDGRRILRLPPGTDLATYSKPEEIIPVHPDFRLFILANRPGFPFLGNDFFRECGDVFAVHVIENPDHMSEVEMLRNYAPGVPLETLQRLSAAFTDIRRRVDDGTLQYPYSTRELVHIAKHLQVFEETALGDVLEEVFDFEKHDYQTRQILAEVFEQHGISLEAGVDGRSGREPSSFALPSGMGASGEQLRKALRQALRNLSAQPAAAQKTPGTLSGALQGIAAGAVAGELLKRTTWQAGQEGVEDAVATLLPSELRGDIRAAARGLPAGANETFGATTLRSSLANVDVMRQLEQFLASSQGGSLSPAAASQEDMLLMEELRQAASQPLSQAPTQSRQLPLGGRSQLQLQSAGSAASSAGRASPEQLMQLMARLNGALDSLPAGAGGLQRGEAAGEMGTAAAQVAQLVAQLAEWQRASAELERQLQQGDTSQRGQGGQGDGEGEGDGQGQGRGRGGSGGAGSGGSGSGVRSGEGGGQGGALQSDGRGGYDAAQLAGAVQEDEEALRTRAQELQKSIQEITYRIENNEALNELRLGDPRSMEEYDELVRAVERQIQELRVIFDAAEAREKEREWIANQTSGDLDDNKLIDGVTGERLIYRRRGEPEKPAGMFQRKPKRLMFVVDVSASMMRFNGEDGRLDRMAQTMAMVLEVLQGREHKFDYAVVGHSGSSVAIPFIEFGRPPTTRAEKARIISAIRSSAGFAVGGDNTMEATELAIKTVVEKEGDDYLVFVLSDANLGAYDITPKGMGELLCRDEKVNAFAVFLSEPEAAQYLLDGLPLGKGYVCLNMAELPQTFKAIFAHAAAS